MKNNLKKIIEKISNFFSNRNIILAIITVLIGGIYIVTLFNIQVINGKEYREKSEKKMLRNETIIAARGEITDRNGVILATNKLSFDLILYKVKSTNEEQNTAIFNTIQILESNGDKIYSTFPINDEKNGFSFSTEEELTKWKSEMNIKKEYNFDQTIDYYIDKYKLTPYKREYAIKIIMVRYEASLMGYSLFKPATIAKDISEKSLAMLEEEKFKLFGLDTISVPKRYYPEGLLAAHTIGYVSRISSEEYTKLKDSGYTQNSNIGKMGIEQTYEKYLKGIDGVRKVEVDSYGTVSSENDTTKSITGQNVTLTIDYRLQKVAEESLIKVINEIKVGTPTMKKHEDASAGSVVVLDTVTGEILAMVSYPSFDINSFVDGINYKEWNILNTSALTPMVNRSISGLYSPGSTYKMLVGLAGLNAGKITPTEKINDPGIYPFGHNPKCWIYEMYKRTHGNINVSEAIKVSCNCYFYEVGRRVGISDIVSYAKLFGLGEKTGVEIAGEKKGQIAGDNYTGDWYLGETLSAAIGQSYNSYTPIQLTNYISTIANGGTLNKVTVIKSIQDSENNYVNLDELNKYGAEFTGVNFESRSLNLKEENINAIKQGMLSVTNDRGGTSYNTFKDLGIEVAGKTGTAEVSSGSSNGIFVGFAPYDKPKIAIVAIIEHGGEGTYTANVVRPIMDEYFKIDKEDKLNEKKENVVENGVVF
ncbi:MAG: penicillin-binding protein 2 [Clostridia bacterium]|nr:penicillin-binding protein 2 [Clostridia bacterium]